MSNGHCILFAGGGTGGHIYPNLAVLEQLRDMGVQISPQFLVSDRPLDRQILDKAGEPAVAVTAQPLRMRPGGLLRFALAFRQGKKQVRTLIRETHAAAMIATGGFVSGPAIAAARSENIPVALVNLDAVPGRANRAFAGKASTVFTAYPNAQLPTATHVGLPLRAAALASVSPQQARSELGLQPQRDTLLVTAGSQGAVSINRMMIELAQNPQHREMLADWQILHLAGAKDAPQVQAAYDAAQLPAKVLAFCDAMGLAWAAATVAISRAGAGSVAEVQANCVPTIFLPYPYHKDEHQKLNAKPAVDAGGALLLRDLIEPAANAGQIAQPLRALIADAQQRDAMRTALASHRPPDGAKVIAQWTAQALAQT